jgi:hypothetical protein
LPKHRSSSTPRKTRARTPRSGADPAAPATADISAVREILIAGELPGARLIPHTMTSLIMLVGRYEDGERVLTPHVELKLASDQGGESGADEEAAFSAVLSLENASFILADFAGDLANIGGYLHSMTSNELPLDPDRMAFVLKNLKWARTEVDKFITIAREIRAARGFADDPEW